jgi:hypothetical protein
MSQLYQHLGANIIKGTNEIILQKDCESFLVLFTFLYERIFEWNLLQLIIENTCSCPNISHVLC